MKPARHPTIAFAALSVLVDAGQLNELRLLPAGTFKASDGRPAGLPGWRLDAASAARIIARVAARQTRTVIDYEHQTLHAERNGQPAPAAGWFSTLEWRDDGLYAVDVEWTDKARQMIAAKEYQYISPVFPFHRATGEVLDLQMAGLTNHPALDELGEIALRAAASRYDVTAIQAMASKLIDIYEEPDMPEILIALLAALSLPETATKDQALAALKALQDSVTTKDTEIAALKAQQPDPAKYVPIDSVKQLQDEMAALKAKDIARDVDQVVKGALADGRIAPSLEAWARDLGQKDIAALKAYVEKATPIPALAGTQSGGKPPAGTGDGTLTEADVAMCKQLGISEDEFKKANSKAA